MYKTLSFLSMLFAVISLSGTEVTVTASAQGEFSAAREQALTLALHDAVRQGAGVEIISASETKNLALVEDVVFSRSLGYVKSYKIIDRSFDSVRQIYSVTIRASVSDKPLSASDDLAVRLLLKRLKAPIAVIRAEEDIEGIKSRRTASDVILTELARKMGIQVLDKKALDERRKNDAARASFDEQDAKAAQKINSVSENPYDFIITSEVTGEISPLYKKNSIEVRDCGFDIVLKAVWADTAENIAVMPIHNAKFDGRNSAYFSFPYRMPRQLVSTCLNKILLNKENQFPAGNAEIFFRRILKKWIVELDLGVNTQIRVLKADKVLMDKIVETLKKTAGITQVRFRNFDSHFYSVLEVESKADYRALCNIIQQCAPSLLRLDAATPRRLTFETKPQK